MTNELRIAVLIPCWNEELSIRTVVTDFRKALPESVVYVYDNNCTDQTSHFAMLAGAIVRTEPLQGKGNVVRRMFADIEADVYLLVDGDDTYDAASAPDIITRLLRDSLDMVNAARVSHHAAAYRPGHRFGNALLSSLVALTFGSRIKDVLSGYRAFSRRFVKSFPAMTIGFEIETELTVHALELGMPIAEIPTPYKERRCGSLSKLRTIGDGLRILKTIALLVKEERPLHFFFFWFISLAGLSIILASPVVLTYIRTGLVPRFPTAILSTGLIVLAFISLTCGLILDTVTRGRKELKRMHYLGIPAPPTL